MANVCVFLGASTRAHPALLGLASSFGALLARRGHTVIYGGCSTGMMGALADGALFAGGQVLGILPESLKAREPGHRGLSELTWVNDLQVRKRLMSERADAFVALPGGYGTLDELFEVLTDRVVGTPYVDGKPVGVLNPDGYYDGMLAFLQRATADGLLAQSEHDRLIVAADGEALLAGMGL